MACGFDVSYGFVYALRTTLLFFSTTAKSSTKPYEVPGLYVGVSLPPCGRLKPLAPDAYEPYGYYEYAKCWYFLGSPSGSGSKALGLITYELNILDSKVCS